MRLGSIVMMLVLAVTPVLAKRNVPDFALVYKPTTAVGDVAAPVVPPGVAIAFEVLDARRNTEPDYLGTRTDDDDVKFTLRATNDVPEFVREALRASAVSWGIPVDETSDYRLALRLEMFRVHETNQAVGATYEAEVRLSGRMELPDGAVAEVMRVGDATRYGKKFSNVNCNEVLSDALREAFAALLDDPRLWKGKDPMVVATAGEPAGDPLTPDGLLEKLLELRAEGFGDKTIVTFLDKQTLAGPLTADDLRKWKERGIEESWMQRAMKLPVRP